MKRLSDQLLSCVCDYLDVSSLSRLYGSYDENDHYQKNMLGSCLHSIHTGILCHETTFADCEDAINCLDFDEQDLMGWIWTAPESVRSINLFFPRDIDKNTVHNVFSALRHSIHSKSYRNIETIVLVIASDDDDITESTCSLRHVIAGKCRSGELKNLRELLFDFDEKLNIDFRMIQADHFLLTTQFFALRENCPFLHSVSPVCLAFDSDYIRNCFNMNERVASNAGALLSWTTIASLDLSGLLCIFADVADLNDVSLEDCSGDLIKSLSGGLYTSLTKISYRDQDFIRDGPDTLLHFIAACYTYIDKGGLEFFGSEIRVLEIDSRELDVDYGFYHRWTELSKQASKMRNLGIHSPHLNGLFPNLEVLRCNRWFPCAQLLRLFCGTKSKTSSLKLEVSPGVEDPSFSSFLVNLWNPVNLPISCFLIRRKRRLVHGAKGHFCNYDVGYLNPESKAQGALQSIEERDNRPHLLDLQSFEDEHREEDGEEESTAVDDAIYSAMKNGQFRGVEVLGVSESFLKSRLIFFQNILDLPSTLASLSEMLGCCCKLQTLVIYPDCELRCPLSADRMKKFVDGVVVLLSSIRRVKEDREEEEEKEAKRKNGIERADNSESDVAVTSDRVALCHLSDDTYNDENHDIANDDVDVKEDVGHELWRPRHNPVDRSLIEKFVIDAPSKFFYARLRERFLSLMELEVQDPAVVATGGLDNEIKNKNEKLLTVQIQCGSQSRTFTWEDRLGVILRSTQESA